MGYLEGTQKAGHTIKNYRSDLASFQQFLEKELGRNPVALSQLSREDLGLFHDHLKSQGLKTNTRRRKLLTVRRLLRYLTKRNQLNIDVGDRLPTPHKLEKVPYTVQLKELITSIQALPVQAELEERNRVLLWALAETGCQVSEITRVRFEDWSTGNGGRSATLSLAGKSPRMLAVSPELYNAVQSLKARSGERPWLFLGFNKFGALGAPITPRGVELLVKAYSVKLRLDLLTPRTFRHSAVISWFKDGVSREEIQKRLGLKTPYAFRAYEPIFKSIESATSTGETDPRES